MPNPDDPAEAECHLCHDMGYVPGTYDPCPRCRGDLLITDHPFTAQLSVIDGGETKVCGIRVNNQGKFCHKRAEAHLTSAKAEDRIITRTPTPNPWLTPMTVEATLVDVDPELLALLYGGSVTPSKDPTFSVEMWSPVKRRWWQRVFDFLLRRPTKFNYFLIPNARLTSEEEENHD